MFRTAHLLSALFSVVLIVAIAQRRDAPIRDLPDRPNLESQQPAPLKVSSTLVPVRVVVRDSKGQTIGGLKKEDFEILDEGKSQPISQFFAFTRGAAQLQSQAPSEQQSQSKTQTPSTPTDDADSIYTVYLFDDLHIERDDFSPARDAAVRHLDSLAPSEFAALVTTSGQPGQDFNLDREQLRKSLLNLKPQDRLGECLKLTYYQADQIENQQNPNILSGAVDLAIACGVPQPRGGSHVAAAAAESAAREAVALGRADSARSLLILSRLVRRLSKAPGQRNIILISNGIFFERYQDENEVIDLAVRGNVTVNALDPAGLQPLDMGLSTRGIPKPGNGLTGAMAQQENQSANWAFLNDLTLASGGTFFHGNNDLDDGFRRVDGAPDNSYLLAFTPSSASKPGQFHKLKVRVTTDKSLKIQARTGYYVPSK